MHVYSVLFSHTLVCDFKETSMPYDDKAKESIDKYREKQSFLQIRVSPEEKELIANHAKDHGESVNRFVTRAIKETIKRDNRKRSK